VPPGDFFGVDGQNGVGTECRKPCINVAIHVEKGKKKKSREC
jgi:hypothetical protein